MTSPLDQILQHCDMTIEKRAKEEELPPLRRGVKFVGEQAAVDFAMRAARTADASARAMRVLAEALESVRSFNIASEHPEHELRHILAVEIPHEIDEALTKAAKILTEGK